MTSILTALWVGLTLALVWGVARWIPQCQHSVFRYRQWRIRDEIMDRAFAGEIPLDHPAVEDLRLHIERGILIANELTIGTWFLASLFESASDTTWVPADGLTSEQQTMLNRWRHATAIAHLKHMVSATPLGWFIVLTSPVFAAGVKVRNMLRGRQVTVKDYVVGKVVATVTRDELIAVPRDELSICV